MVLRSIFIFLGGAMGLNSKTWFNIIWNGSLLTKYFFRYKEDVFIKG